MPKEAVTLTDHRTDKTYELPIEHETIRAMDLRKIKVAPDDFGLMTYDPAFMNTACCKSNITFIDGDKGILRYRGYDIDDLAENCTFLQVVSHHAARDHEAVHRWLPLRRAPDGNSGEHASSAFDGVSRGSAGARL